MWAIYHDVVRGHLTNPQRRSRNHGWPCLPSSAHLRSQHLRVLRPGIARGAQQAHIAEAHRPKLVEEGSTFLGARNSREPVGRTLLDLRWQRGL